MAKALIMADGYKDQMAENIDAVKIQSEQVRIQAQLCSYYVLGNIDENVSKRNVYLALLHFRWIKAESQQRLYKSTESRLRLRE